MLADRTVFQVDQTASGHQAVLRDQQVGGLQSTVVGTDHVWVTCQAQTTGRMQETT